MSKLTVTLPDDLHAQIRQELEEQGITTGQFIEMVVTKYFTKDKKGENNMATRTIAFQVFEELYQRCQRHRQLGRQLRVLCQDRPRRRADDPVCPLFRHLRYGWSAGADWTGDCLCGTYREGDGKSSAF